MNLSIQEFSSTLRGLAMAYAYGFVATRFGATAGALVVVLWGVVFRLAERSAERQRLRQALSGKVDPKTLSKLLRMPQSFKMDASEQVITLMFIDIVGFSLASEAQSPKEAFSHLKEQMNYLTAAVHKYGGIVDKSLGDGLFCYFGYYHKGMSWQRDHASAAIDCAHYIQEQNVARMQDAKSSNEPIYPLRIGINTAAVYIGDIGDNGRVDFTVIGHGVNYAQRLEAACDSNLVMIGSATASLLPDRVSKHLKLRRKFVQVKHHEELIEAYELNPFVNQPEVLESAINCYREFAGISRLATRWETPKNADIWVDTDFGRGTLANFSATGFQVVFPRYIAKGAKISLRIETTNNRLRERLIGMGLVPLMVEVRWAAANDSGCLLGVLIKSLSIDKRKFLLTTLREALSEGGAIKKAA